MILIPLLSGLIGLVFGVLVLVTGGICLIVGVCEIFDGLFSKSKKTIDTGVCLLMVAAVCAFVLLLSE